jgi:prepilin-type N-terminal cleavage/methylation domain-containing protein
LLGGNDADDKMIPKHHRKFGYSMTELLCVIAIISILAAIYLGVIAKALIHIRKFLHWLGGSG